MSPQNPNPNPNPYPGQQPGQQPPRYPPQYPGQYPPQYQGQYPGQYPGQMPPKKKTSPWVWVAVAVGVFFIVALLAGAAVTYFVWHKVKQAGLDPALMEKNPALAVTKILATTNPNVEVLGVDESRGIIRVRDKKDGKVLIMNFEDAKQGKFVFQEEGKEALVISQAGDGKAPDWAPLYPGAKMEGNVSLQSGEGESGSFHFTTKDAPDKVAAFYESALKGAGMNVNSNTTRESGVLSGGMVMGQDEAKKRTVMVTIGTESGSTTVAVVFGTKN